MFKSGHTKVLVVPDAVSRGLDIPKVNLVVNHNIHSGLRAKSWSDCLCLARWAGGVHAMDSMITPNDVALVQAIEARTAVKWSELEADDKKVAEIVVQVNTVRREGEIEENSGRERS